MKRITYQEFINKLTTRSPNNKVYFVLVIPYMQRTKVVAAHQAYGVN